MQVLTDAQWLVGVVNESLGGEGGSGAERATKFIGVLDIVSIPLRVIRLLMPSMVSSTSRRCVAPPDPLLRAS